MLERALDAGQDSVKRGPDLLAVLRDAGVVDAGGYGLTIIFAGVIAALRGAEPPPLEHHAPARVTHPEHESSTYRFCTNFAVEGEDLDADDWIRPLEALGDSVLVVGERTTLKVHVHTDDPEAATRLFAQARRGLPPRRGRHARAGRPAHARAWPSRVQRCAALAVVDGRRACASCSRASGRSRSRAAPTLNPSTYELLAGIHEAPAEEVVVLPNSPERA